MSTDPSAALDDFLAAIREHFAAAKRRTSPSDPKVEATYMALADAFEIYEDALYTAYEEVTPFELFDDVEDEGEDAEDDDFDDDDEDDLDDDDLDEDDEDLDDDFHDEGLDGDFDDDDLDDVEDDPDSDGLDDR